VGINPEALRGLGRALLNDPRVRVVAGVVDALAPDLGAAVRELDRNLPDVVAAVEIEARRNVSREVRGLDKRAARAIRGLVDEALVSARKRLDKGRRLGPAKGKRK
jgi:Arc/MetJ family transcription regulator